MSAHPIVAYPLSSGGNATTPGQVQIASQILASAAATISFSSIPQTYTSLMLVVTGTNTSGSSQVINLNVNGDAGANYFSSGFFSNQGSSFPASYGNPLAAANQWALGAFASTSGNSLVQVFFGSYTAASIKMANTICNFLNPAAGGNCQLQQSISCWNSTASITSIALSLASGNFSAGCVATLYGIQ